MLVEDPSQLLISIDLDNCNQANCPQEKPFSVIMDETTDGSTKLQVAISLHLTDEETGIAQEHLVAMVEESNSTGEALAQKLLDVLPHRQREPFLDSGLSNHIYVQPCLNTGFKVL